MASREIPQESTAPRLSLGEENQANYDAIANRTEITEAASGLLRSIGDFLSLRPNVEHRREERAERQNQTRWITRLKDVVDTILEWLENSGRTFGLKQEQVLRGLYNLTGEWLIGKYILSIVPTGLNHRVNTYRGLSSRQKRKVFVWLRMQMPMQMACTCVAAMFLASNCTCAV